MPDDTDDDTLAMVNLLDRVLDYRTLRGIRDELTLPLRPAEAERLSALEQQFASEAPPESQALFPRRRSDARHPVAIDLEHHEAGKESTAGVMRDLSAGGLFVETSLRRRAARTCCSGSPTSPPGAPSASPRRWCGRTARDGLRFAGVPLRMQTGHFTMSAPPAALEGAAA